MRKIIHHLRKQSEEDRRHILHILTFFAGIILITLWVYSLSITLTSPENKVQLQQDSQPFSILKDNIIGGYKSITGSNQ